MKKSISVILLLLALMVLARPFCVPATAATDVSGNWGELEWSYSDGTLTISGNGPMEDDSAPWEYLAWDVEFVRVENGVTSIGDGAFCNFTELWGVELATSVEKIGENAFFNCSSLVDITDEYSNHRFPDSVQVIGDGAFAECNSLQDMILGDHVRYIGDYAFSGCTNLVKVVLSPALESIGDYSFDCCSSLGNLFIPASVSYIGDHAFGDCYNVDSICFEGNAPEIHERAFESFYGTVQAMAYYPEGNTSWTFEKQSDYGGMLTWMTKDPDCLATGVCGDNLTWQFTDDGTLWISGNGEMECFDWWYDSPWSHLSELVDAIYIENGITAISQYAFLDFQRASVVTLPNGLTDIGRYAFFRCYNLERIISGDEVDVLPDSLQTIEGGAFCNCHNLQEINMGPNVVSVGNMAFSGCTSLEKISLSPAITEIPFNTFANCFELRSVLIPEAISYIGEGAFAECNNLKNIGFAGDAPEIHDTAFSNVEATVYYPCENSSWDSDKLPDYGGALTWESADAQILSGEPAEDDLEWFLAQDDTLVITGSGAMADYLFCDAPWADLYEQICTIYIDDGVTTIGENAFSGFSNVVTVRLPDSLTKIGDAAFNDCRELYWILNADLEQKLPEGLRTIGSNAFTYCMNLSELTMGNNVTSLGNGAFDSCVSLKQITLSPALNYIGKYAFAYAFDLRTVYFPAEVSYIGDYAFYYCTNLKEIVFNGDAPYIGDNAFALNDPTVQATAYYSAGNTTWTADKRIGYGADITWKTKSADCMGVGACGDDLTWELKQDGTLYISGKGAMYNYDTIDYPPWYGCRGQITAVVIEEGVTTIGDLAFYYCKQLRSVTIPDSLTMIGFASFMECDNLSYIEIGANVVYIGEHVFCGCELLQTFTVAKENPAYANDSYGVLFDKNMETLIAAPGAITGHYDIPYGVIKIGDDAFIGCNGLTGITIPNTVTTIGNGAFSCCFGLTSVTIPASVTLIDHAAFWYCNGLEKIEFGGDAPTFIGDSIFVNVSATATYPAGNPTWTADKFIHPDSNITWVAAEPVVELPNITLCYPTLLLEDEIKMMVYYTINQDIHLERMGMLTWTSKPDVVSVHTADAVISGASFDPVEGLYSVTTQGIPAQNLGDEIYFSIYAELSDGNLVYSNPVKYSPTTYAYNQLNGGADAPTKALYVAILNYGAAAQKFLNYKTDALANANLTDEQKALVVPFYKDMVQAITKPNVTKQGTLAANGGFTAKNPTISLDSAFAINYYFTPSAEVAGNMAFYYWNASDFTAADVLSTDNATGSYAMVNENGVYGAAIKGIAAKDINSAVYVCGVYTDVNGNSYSTGILPYSLGCYCGNQVKANGSTANLAAAIAVYGYYAASYFE